MKKQYDIIIVGSGIFGATVACKANQEGKKCLVLERRNKIGGNIRDELENGIYVHRYGAHIFHTDNETVWRFVNKFTRFVPYVHTVIARNANKLYHLPFNMNTFYDVYGTITPDEVTKILEGEQKKEWYDSPKNLEEKAINLVGRKIYELLIKGYTEKQWGRKAIDMEANLIERLPIRDAFDNRYFNDRYQGIPELGYSNMIYNMLNGIEVRCCVNFLEDKEYWFSLAENIVYTGAVDELMNYKLGELGYRSLSFDTKVLNKENFQGIAVINETGADVPYTRTIEHKHFYYNKKSKHTVVTREYPLKWQRGLEPYYAINNEINNNLYKKYSEEIKTLYPKIVLGGRLGDYKYYDMDDVIAKALDVLI